MRVLKVEYLSDYKLKILFSNKKTKIVNLEKMLDQSKGIFLPLKNLDYFKKVDVDDCHLSICWPNGADICPDVLYDMGKDVKVEIEAVRSKKRIKRLYRVPKRFAKS